MNMVHVVLFEHLRKNNKSDSVHLIASYTNSV